MTNQKYDLTNQKYDLTNKVRFDKKQKYDLTKNVKKVRLDKVTKGKPTPGKRSRAQTQRNTSCKSAIETKRKCRKKVSSNQDEVYLEGN